MRQIQRSAGPCVSAIRSGARVTVCGAPALSQRWGAVGRAIADTGFESVDAHPMRRQGQVQGGVNIFRSESGEISEEIAALSQGLRRRGHPGGRTVNWDPL